ncbi:AMP-binding protein [Pseudomonas matsuisoli]|uniref:Acetyl-CoA synthetase n=1 Tax=Pseudomonas matsuisoli TaxID=1515666 RepID=A0A917PN03_9PSED|nr:AMP-binding protein [Pseudomonas matsuisoli]GGJ85577.1 acetyl-CoA synthetase [Pseudomonas matsuisoli]
MNLTFSLESPAPEAFFNIADACCDRWAEREPDRVALLQKNSDGSVTQCTYRQLQASANRLANALAASGIRPGDRVGIMLPQRLEAAFAHIALYKLGAIAVPLFVLFGLDAIRHRARDCAMSALITDGTGRDKLAAIWGELPDMKVCFCTAGRSDDSRVLDYHAETAVASDRFETRHSVAEDPAVIIYTSGTTGHPKGALHAHRVLLGHVPGVSVSHEGLPQAGDLIWTPADWAWIGGLLDVLLPSLYLGVPVVAHRAEKFEPEAAFALIEELGIRNLFLPPTALKLLRQVPSPETRWLLSVRTIASGGESLGSELLNWGRQTFGVTINEFYGQTECNIVLSSCSRQGVHKVGAIGQSVPGYNVRIIDDQGNEMPAGDAGDIAVETPNLNQMLCYWNRPDATAEKYVGRWLVTGDRGYRDADGYIHFLGRNDDVITSAGYRIGPTPIEDCLLRHPAVKLAAAIGKKDATRTEIVKACIVLADGHSPSPGLISELQNHVRTHLAAHEYPREIEFLEALPMTATGKIIRGELRQREHDKETAA